MSNLRLPFDADATPPVSPAVARDLEARAFAVDPRVNVALEASAGTGKTRVLVDRYVNLLRAGVEPAPHPGDDLHAQGRGGDAGPHPHGHGRGGRAGGLHAGAVARAARSHGRHRRQHHRRVLPVAAARVSARGGSRSGLLRGGRRRAAAADRRVARSRAAHLPRPGPRRRGRGAGLRATGRPSRAAGAGQPARAAAGGAGRAGPIRVARFAGLDRADAWPIAAPRRWRS